MARISAETLPADALLDRYRDAPSGDSLAPYTDCFGTLHEGAVTLEQFVFAFYTTRVFKLERLILRFAAKKPSTDADALAVANGSATRFAAWFVEDRTESELLMCDFRKKTRSWFKVMPAENGKATRLLFGSAVVPDRDPRTGEMKMGRAFEWLIGFHKLYSSVLLGAATARLADVRRSGQGGLDV